MQSKYVCSYYFPWFGKDIMMHNFFSWLGLLKMKVCRTIFMWFSMSAYIPTHYTDLHANILLFSVPMWLMFSYFNAFCCNVSGILYISVWMITSSITAMSSLNIHYVLMSHSNWSLLTGHPCMMYSFSHWRCFSWYVTYLSSWTLALWHICS